MSAILPAGLTPSYASFGLPLGAGEPGGSPAGLSRDAAIPDLQATSASVNQLQSLATSASSGASASLMAMPAPTLPPPQLQPPTSTDPLKGDYFTDGDPGDAGAAPVL